MRLAILVLVLSNLCSLRASAEPIACAQDILHQPDSAYIAQIPFELSGQVLSCAEHNFTFRDTSGTISIQADPALLKNIRPGHFIRTHGELCISDQGNNDKRARGIEITGFAPVPELQDVTASQIESGAFVYQRVRVRGVLSSVSRDEMDYNYLWLLLRTNEGSIPVAIRDDGSTLSRTTAMIDGQISVSGTLTRLSPWTRPFPYFVSIDTGLDSLVLETPPSADPFVAPPLATSHTLQRQRADGIVLATADSHFYLHTPWRRQLKVIPAAGSRLPRAGETVSVVGFAEGNQYDLRLVDALVREEHQTHDTVPAPQPVTAARLFQDANDERNLNVQHNGRLITIEGDLPYVPEGEIGRLVLACDTHHLILDLSGLPQHDVRRLSSGMRLRATGLCLAEFENDDSSALFPKFRHYVLLPRSIDDLEIIRSAPWWTPAKFLALIGILFAAVVFAAIWICALRILSRRRGAQLFAEQIDHARSELKVAERTRLAVELHDNLAQTLTAVNLQIETAKRYGDASRPELITHLEIAAKTLSSCREELRNCLWDLRSEALESTDMTTAIRQALKPNTEHCQLQVRFAVPRELLSDKTAHTILCIIRELSVNAIRHGHADQLKIAGSIEDNVLRFSVRDNGSGFDPDRSPGIREGHFGLQGIRERVGQLNGTFSLRSHPGSGTRAEVSVKLAEVHRNTSSSHEKD